MKESNKKKEQFLHTVDLMTVMLKTLCQEEVIKKATYDDLLKCVKDLRNFQVNHGDLLEEFWNAASPFNPNIVSLRSDIDRPARQIAFGDMMVQLIKNY